MHRYTYALLGLLLSVAPIAGACAAPSAPDAAAQPSLPEAVRRAVATGGSTMSCHFDYELASSDVVETETNRAEIARLRDFLRKATADTLLTVQGISLDGYCSPEGPEALNTTLSWQRAEGLHRWLQQNTDIARAYDISVRGHGADWQGLRNAAAASATLYGRDELLRVLDLVSLEDGRQGEAARVMSGIPWRQATRQIFPALRRVDITVSYDLRRTLERTLARPLTDAEYEAILARERAGGVGFCPHAGRLGFCPSATNGCTTCPCASWSAGLCPRAGVNGCASADCGCYAAGAAPAPAMWATHRTRRPAREGYFRPYLAIKTNLPQVAGLMPNMKTYTPTPNLMVEYFVLPWLSVEGKAVFANWDYDQRQNEWLNYNRQDADGSPGVVCYDTQHHGVSAYSGEVRYWPIASGKHHWLYCGLYGQVGDFTNSSYDDDRNKRHDTTDGLWWSEKNLTGSYWQAGLSLGTYIPFNEHLGVEIGLRAGYQHTKQYAYQRIPADDDYCWADPSSSSEHYHLAPVNINDDHTDKRATITNKFRITETRIAFVYRIGKWFR